MAIFFFICLFTIISITSTFQLPPELEAAFIQPDHERYIVLLCHRLGLANRLRAMADWYVIAQRSNRKLVVSWAPSFDCAIEFTSLFQSEPPGLEVLTQHLPESSDAAMQFLIKAAERRNVTYHAYTTANDTQLWSNRTARAQGFLLDPLVVFSDVQAIFTVYDGLLVLDQMPCQLYMKQRQKFLQQLLPNNYSLELVNSLIKDYFSNSISIGVHIRAHNPLFDWAIIPSIDGHPQARNFGEDLTIEHYISAMRDVWNHFSYETENGQKKSYVRFFIASNNPDEKAKAMSVFDDAVSVNGDYSRGSADGMQFALIEWLLLTRMDMIIHHYGSTFAMEAAAVSGAPLLSLWGRVRVLGRSILQPFCSDVQFAQAYAANAQTTTIIESLLSGEARKVEGAALQMKQCNVLESWGLPEVYCLSEK